MQPSQSGGGTGPCATIMHPSQSGGGTGPCETGPLLLPLVSSVTHIKRDPPINLLFTTILTVLSHGTPRKESTTRHNLAYLGSL
jgi:hypothetical protein